MVPTPRLLEALGCDVVAVTAGGGTPSPAGLEPEEGNLAEIGNLVRHTGADIGFAQNAGAYRLAVVDECGTPLGADATVGAACASDAFYPVPDAIEACLDAGVTAFIQPGGSMRDQEAIATVDAAGATMLITGVRHFRH